MAAPRALEGRTAVITGANQGLGLAMARAYVEAGASLCICARDPDKLEAAADELRALAGAGQRVVAVAADVSEVADVGRVAAAAFDAFERIHVLVCNAGVYGPMGPSEDVDWDEWSRAVRINIDGSVLPCRAFIPHFKTHRYGKIVQISGGGATAPLPRLSAYATSKAAIVRFAESIALELREFGVDVNAIAPGALNTRMLDEVLAAGPERVGQAFFDRMVKTKAEGGTPLETGAALSVFLGSAASDGITGRLLSAAWDPWADLPAQWAELEKTDIYTLRRIVPADRGCLGSVGGLAGSVGRSREDRHLYPSPYRSRPIADGPEEGLTRRRTMRGWSYSLSDDDSLTLGTSRSGLVDLRRDGDGVRSGRIRPTPDRAVCIRIERSGRVRPGSIVAVRPVRRRAGRADSSDSERHAAADAIPRCVGRHFQRRRARPARARVFAGLRGVAPIFCQLHRPEREHGGGAFQTVDRQSAGRRPGDAVRSAVGRRRAVHRAAVREPQRWTPRVRS